MAEAAILKPDPKFFDMATQAIGAEPNQILFFDDHQPNVAGARQAGWRSELYRIGEDMQALLRGHGV